MTHPNTTHHAAFDIGAIALTLGSFTGALPYIAAALAVIWYCVLLYDRFINKRTGKDP